MSLSIFISPKTGRGYFEAVCLATAGPARLYVDDLLSGRDSLSLENVANLDFDFDEDPLFALVSLSAKAVLGRATHEETERAYEYICSALSDLEEETYRQVFIARCSDYLDLGEERVAYLCRLAGVRVASLTPALKNQTAH